VETVAKDSLTASIWLVAGNLGFLLGGFRVLSVFIGTEKQSWKMNETWAQVLLLLGGVAVIFLIGLLPGWFLRYLIDFLKTFSNL